MSQMLFILMRDISIDEQKRYRMKEVSTLSSPISFDHVFFSDMKNEVIIYFKVNRLTLLFAERNYLGPSFQIINF